MSESRFRSLDALRGVAALVVVVHHCFLTSAAMAEPYRGTRVHGSAAWWSYSPLHVVWAGNEAVGVFFVLSGFVLAVPATRGRRQPWRAYYPSRLLRLYLPTFVALALALPQAAFLRRDYPLTRASFWMNYHDTAVTTGRVFHDALLIDGTDWIDSALWSLQWEVVFSLALPLFLLLLRASAGMAAAGAVALGLVSVLGTHTGHAAAVYLPYFAIGVLACAHRGALVRVAERSSGWLLTAGLAAIWLRWVCVYARADQDLIGLLMLVAAVLVTVSFLGGRVASWSGSSPWAGWLGRRSFSLYLVHEPIVVTVNHLGGDLLPAWEVVLIGLPISLAAAELFGRLVEEPSHRLAKTVGRRLATLRSEDAGSVLRATGPQRAH